MIFENNKPRPKLFSEIIDPYKGVVARPNLKTSCKAVTWSVVFVRLLQNGGLIVWLIRRYTSKSRPCLTISNLKTIGFLRYYRTLTVLLGNEYGEGRNKEKERYNMGWSRQTGKLQWWQWMQCQLTQSSAIFSRLLYHLLRSIDFICRC